MLLSVLFGSKMMTYGHSLQRLHEENEKLFDRLTEKASVAASPQVCSIPISLDLLSASQYTDAKHTHNDTSISVYLCAAHTLRYLKLLLLFITW